MTTITLERAFMIRVLEQLDVAQALLERSQHHTKIAAMYEELRAALAAPATAPEKTAWHDAPTVPGNWILETLTGGLELFEEITQTEINNETTWPGRWYGPIPPDGDKP